MKAYRTVKEMAPDGMLQLDALPFRAGERVEIIILAAEEARSVKPASIRG